MRSGRKARLCRTASLMGYRRDSDICAGIIRPDRIQSDKCSVADNHPSRLPVFPSSFLLIPIQLHRLRTCWIWLHAIPLFLLPCSMPLPRCRHPSSIRARKDIERRKGCRISCEWDTQAKGTGTAGDTRYRCKVTPSTFSNLEEGVSSIWVVLLINSGRQL
jgi:hypothetical protein